MLIETLAKKGTTFQVADVEPAASPLSETPYAAALERLLESERLSKGEDYRPIEACTKHDRRLVDCVDHHPVVSALSSAYAQHRPISLSPDMIWLMICQGAAHHINANAEELRPRFVRHDGQIVLAVRRDDFVKTSPDNDWPSVFGDFSAQIRKHVGPAHDLFIASFSTTGPTEQAASEIVLMDAMRRYFHLLLMRCICGIPAITLEGEPADWRSIADRVEGFAPAGMDWWLSRLRPILRQFVAAAEGDVDRPFWQSIYRQFTPGEPCSASSGMGWINLFFPYLNDREGSATRRNPWLTGERDLEELLTPPDLPSRGRGLRRGNTQDLAAHRHPGYVFESHLPSGLAKAPFTWEDRDLSGRLLCKWDMEFLGGFVGVTQEPETLALRPEIGWAVREAVTAS